MDTPQNDPIMFTYTTDFRVNGSYGDNIIYNPSSDQKVDVRLTQAQLEVIQRAMEFMNINKLQIQSCVLPNIDVRVNEQWLDKVSHGDKFHGAKLEVSAQFGTELIISLKQSSIPVTLELPDFTRAALACLAQLHNTQGRIKL